MAKTMKRMLVIFAAVAMQAGDVFSQPRPGDVFREYVWYKQDGDAGKAVAAQLVWSSWIPGYMDGVYINDAKVFDNEGPKYQYYAHRVTIKDTSCFKQGVNVLKTGNTPKINGQMVHGMEVNWPGIMVLIQYREDR